MKKTKFNELLEKAFSLGYEYSLEEQKEFGNKENKRKRRNYEILKGLSDFGDEQHFNFMGKKLKDQVNDILSRVRKKQKSTRYEDNPIKDIHGAILQKTKFDHGASQKRLPDIFLHERKKINGIPVRDPQTVINKAIKKGLKKNYDHLPVEKFVAGKFNSIKDISDHLNMIRKSKN